LHVYVAARHVDKSEGIKQYVEEHLVEPIRGHTGLNVRRVEVQLFADGEKGNHFGCHVEVKVKGNHDINVREIDQTLYAAIDLAKDRVLRQLTELRDKILTVRRHPKKYSVGRLARALGWIGRRRL
jgi:ribosomal subunit interface protein